MPEFLIAIFDVALGVSVAVVLAFYGYVIWSVFTRDPPEPHSRA
jgi:hypothetical protein